MHRPTAHGYRAINKDLIKRISQGSVIYRVGGNKNKNKICKRGTLIYGRRIDTNSFFFFFLWANAGMDHAYRAIFIHNDIIQVILVSDDKCSG